VLTLVPTVDGVLYHGDANGDYWRMMLFIADSKSYDEINPELAYRAGMAFGEFQQMLADLPVVKEIACILRVEGGETK